MKLNLTRPLIVFDLETTGLEIAKDRIIQLSYIKVCPDGTETRADMKINPGRHIPAEVTAITGIADADVKDCPAFKDIARNLAADFQGCDFAGYNSNHFDIPLLAEEFLRNGIDFDFNKARLIDAQTIFFKMEKRDLASAYKFFCGRKMEDDFEAHRSDQDAEATYRVLMGELDMYSPERQQEPDRRLPNDMDALAEFSRQRDNVDFAGRFVWQEVKADDGTMRRVEVFNFGKHKGESVASVLRYDTGYYGWMMNGDFPLDTKQALTRIKLRNKL